MKTNETESCSKIEFLMGALWLVTVKCTFLKSTHNRVKWTALKLASKTITAFIIVLFHLSHKDIACKATTLENCVTVCLTVKACWSDFDHSVLVMLQLWTIRYVQFNMCRNPKCTRTYVKLLNVAYRALIFTNVFLITNIFLILPRLLPILYIKSYFPCLSFLQIFFQHLFIFISLPVLIFSHPSCPL